MKDDETKGGSWGRVVRVPQGPIVPNYNPNLYLATPIFDGDRMDGVLLFPIVAWELRDDAGPPLVISTGGVNAAHLWAIHDAAQGGDARGLLRVFREMAESGGVTGVCAGSTGARLVQ